MELPHTTNKQQEIINLILNLRYLTSKQIQKILNHKDPKTINSWLKNLTDNKYLGRDYTKTFGLDHIPAVYYLGVNGIRYLKKYHNLDRTFAKRLYSEKQKSATFKNHHIFLTDIYLQLKNDKNYTYLSPSQLWEYEELRDLQIDAYIKKKTKRYLLHLFDKQSPNFTLEEKVKQYKIFYNSNQWKEVFASKTFPTVLFILPNSQKLSHLRWDIKKSYPPFHINLTTANEIQAKGFTADIWEEI